MPNRYTISEYKYFHINTATKHYNFKDHKSRRTEIIQPFTGNYSAIIILCIDNLEIKKCLVILKPL